MKLLDYEGLALLVDKEKRKFDEVANKISAENSALLAEIDALKTAHSNTANTFKDMIESLANRVSALEGQLNGITFEVV